MDYDVFVDTSGFYALLATDDPAHTAACDILRLGSEKKMRYMTTDYIIDETATLLKARKLGYIVAEFIDTVIESNACHIEWMNPDFFSQTSRFFLKHADHAWSFTDCFSFIVMKNNNIPSALTKDGDYKAAGFHAMLK
jgi:hypothetical protein